MKVIHVLNSYLPQHIAGTEVYVSALVRELKLQNVTSKIVIPNYGKTHNETYFFEGTEVIKYAEPSTVERAIIMGIKAPKGVIDFTKVLLSEKPDIVHFHELAGSIGIGLFHVEAAKAMGFKLIMTFHLAKYTCKTGTLMYMNQTKCDGIISKIRCSDCWLNETGVNKTSFNVIKAGYTLMHYLHLDTRVLKNSLGTALALPNIILDIRKNMLKLEKLTDGFIVLTEWYKNILFKNGVKQSHLSIINQGLPNSNNEKIKKLKSNNKLSLVFVGRISHFKGVDILLSALKNIDQEKVELTIYGTATEDDYMEKCLLLSLNMKNIFWKGSIEPSKVIDTISLYDVLCIPSAVSEMGPFVLKEAFAASVPVLASNVYGNTEQIIDGVNGWLFKFKNVDDLKNIIDNLINNPSQILFASGNIVKPHNFGVVATEHIKVYDKVLLKR